MLKTIVLICAASLDPSACTTDTALDVIRFPPRQVAVCGYNEMAIVAHTSLAPDAGKSYAKSICERVK